MKRAGIARDVLTFWLRNGLLQPTEAAAGRGKHLRFEWYEANIAAIMNQLRILGMKIEGMLSVVATFRAAIAWAEKYAIDRADVVALDGLFNLHNRRDNGFYSDAEFANMMERFGYEEYGEPRIPDRIKAVHAKMSKNEFYQHIDPYMTITEQPEAGDPREAAFHPDELTYFWRSGEGENYLFAWGEGAVHKSMINGSVSSIALNIPVILWGVWNEPEDGVSAMLARGMKARSEAGGNVEVQTQGRAEVEA